MSPLEPPRGGNRVLAFFGFDTGRKTAETALWAAPYLLVVGLCLAGISALTYSFLGVPLWAHALAELLALSYFFLFLARIRKLVTDPDGGEE